MTHYDAKSAAAKWSVYCGPADGLDMEHFRLALEEAYAAGRDENGEGQIGCCPRRIWGDGYHDRNCVRHRIFRIAWKWRERAREARP